MKLTRGDWLKINEIIRKRNIAHDQVKHINCFRFHKSESTEHRQKKFDMCCELYDKGHPFICEAFTEDRKRKFDVLGLKDDIVYEIETGKSYSKKDDVKEVKI